MQWSLDELGRPRGPDGEATTHHLCVAVTTVAWAGQPPGWRPHRSPAGVARDGVPALVLVDADALHVRLRVDVTGAAGQACGERRLPAGDSGFRLKP